MINVNGYTQQQVIDVFTKNYRKVTCTAKLSGGVELTNNEIISCSIQEQIISSDKFVFGTQNSSALEMEITNLKEQYNPNTFIGQEIQVFFTCENIKVPMGVFVIDQADKNSGKIKITAYDRVLLTSINYNKVTELTYPATLMDIAKNACNISGVMFQMGDFFNSDILLKNMVVFTADVTCRQVLANIAELACGYVIASRDGYIKIKNLEPSKIVANLTTANWISYDYNEQEFGPIKSVYMVYGDGDNAKDKLYGEGSPQFQIRNNYFTPDDFEDLPEKIYNNITNITYYPGTVEYQGIPTIECGDFITITDKKDVTRTLLVTGQTWDYDGGLRCKITSAGSSDEELATETKEIISEKVEGLNKRVNELQQTIDKAKLLTYMKQVDEFSNRLDGLSKEVKEVKQSVTPDGIVNTVTNSKTYQDTLDGIYNGLNGLSGQTVQAESIIAQYADKINMSVKKGNIISEINLDESGVQILGDKIGLTGFVTFSDLAGEGTTTINGDNIKTGTFSGDRIYGGTIEAVNFKGDNVDVMANFTISPEAEPSFQSTDAYYPKPDNDNEWAKIGFKVLTGQRQPDNTLALNEHQTVSLKVFPYKDDIFGTSELDMQKPNEWKYGLEFSGAIKVTDDIYIKGQNGLVVDNSLKANTIYTDEIFSKDHEDSGAVSNGVTINEFKELYPIGAINSTASSSPYISIDYGAGTSEEERRPQLILSSDKYVTIQSLNSNDNPDLVLDKIRIDDRIIASDLKLMDNDGKYSNLYLNKLFIQDGEDAALNAVTSDSDIKIISNNGTTGNTATTINGKSYYTSQIIADDDETQIDNVIVTSKTIGSNVYYKEKIIYSDSPSTDFNYIIIIRR